MRWWVLIGTAGLLAAPVVGCGLDMAGLGDAADGGADAAVPEGASSTEGGSAGEGGTGGGDG
ncbi:MAG: hypothetical protein ACRELB_01690, partial [Polyangiaceae bacterium]